jgi:hypothetical protein
VTLFLQKKYESILKIFQKQGDARNERIKKVIWSIDFLSNQSKERLFRSLVDNIAIPHKIRQIEEINR